MFGGGFGQGVATFSWDPTMSDHDVDDIAFLTGAMNIIALPFLASLLTNYIVWTRMVPFYGG